RREPARDQPPGRRADALIAEAIERTVDLGHQVGRMHDLDVRAVDLGAVDLQRAVEIERDMAVGANERERLAFERREIGRLAQVLAVPGIAIDKKHVDAGIRHGGKEALLAVVLDHRLVGSCYSRQREKRASTRRTSSLSAIAMRASVKTSAIRA